MYIEKNHLVQLKDVEMHDLATKRFRFPKENDKRAWDNASNYVDVSLLQKILPTLIEMDYQVVLSNIKMSKNHNLLMFDIRSLKNTSQVKVEDFYLNNGKNSSITITNEMISRTYQYYIIAGKITLFPTKLTYALRENTFTKILNYGGEAFVIMHGNEQMDIQMTKNDGVLTLPHEEELYHLSMMALDPLTLNQVIDVLNQDNSFFHNFDMILIQRNLKKERGKSVILEKMVVKEKELKSLRLNVRGMSVDVRNRQGDFSQVLKNVSFPEEIPFVNDELADNKVLKHYTRSLEKKS